MHPSTPPSDDRLSRCGFAFTEHETTSPLVKDLALGEETVKLLREDRSQPLASGTFKTLA